MKSELKIVKIGGNVVDNPERLAAFLKGFSTLKGAKILIHGGGKIATDLAEKLNIPQHLIEGRRVTDRDTLRVVAMVYAGLINKSIVAQLIAHKENALGVSGVDGNLIRCRKRSSHPIDYGFVGDVESVNSKVLSDLLKLGFIPVFSPLTHDGKGQLLNTNADTIATEIAIAMSTSYEVKLYFCFEKKGVLRDVNDDDSHLPRLSFSQYEKLKGKNAIHAGMIPKLTNAFKADKKGVKEVYILRDQDLIKPLHTAVNYGTRIISK